MSGRLVNILSPLLTSQISAGEIGTTAEKLEAQLPLIFQRAEKWNAVLLLDEADVFLEQRSPHDVHRNAMISIFLRELKYYQGIMFLTTNRVKEIDDAIASRIHLPLKYKSLGLNARRGIWKSFLKKAITRENSSCYNSEELEILARKDFNDRQVMFFRGCLIDFFIDQSFKSKTLYSQFMFWSIERKSEWSMFILKSLLSRVKTSNAISKRRGKLTI